MKRKYEGKDLQGLVDLGREQGYLTFEQVNDFLPQDVASRWNTTRSEPNPGVDLGR